MYSLCGVTAMVSNLRWSVIYVEGVAAISIHFSKRSIVLFLFDGSVGKPGASVCVTSYISDVLLCRQKLPSLELPSSIRGIRYYMLHGYCCVVLYIECAYELTLWSTTL